MVPLDPSLMKKIPLSKYETKLLYEASKEKRQRALDGTIIRRPQRNPSLTSSYQYKKFHRLFDEITDEERAAWAAHTKQYKTRTPEQRAAIKLEKEAVARKDAIISVLIELMIRHHDY